MTKGVYRRPGFEETSSKIQKLKKLQKLPLLMKIEITKKVINEAVKKGKKFCLLYSGGKDSTVLLTILKEMNIDFFAMYNNTTLADEKFNTFLREQIQKFKVPFIETTAEDPVKMWKEKGYYPILSKRGFTKFKKNNPELRISPVQCCYQLKEKYCNKVLKEKNVDVVFWGNRAGESNRRKFAFVDNGFLFKPKKYTWFQCYPLQHWTDSDIKNFLNTYVQDWNFFKSFENGCLCCATDIQFKKNTLARLYYNDYESWLFYILNGFGEEILKIKNIDPSNLNEIIKNTPEILLRIQK